MAAGDEQSPDILTHRALKKASTRKKILYCAGQHRKVLQALTLEDVRAYFDTVMRPDETIMVVIGDITPEAAESVIVKYFGDWKAAGPKPDLLLPAVPANPASVVHVPNKSRIQDSGHLGRNPGSDPIRSRTITRLSWATMCWGAGFTPPGSTAICARKPAWCTPWSWTWMPAKPGPYYAVEYACDPANVGKARAIVMRNIEAMQDQARGSCRTEPGQGHAAA